MVGLLAGGVTLGVVLTLLAMAAGLFGPGPNVPPRSEWGFFPSPPRAELLDDGRKLRLLEDFAYVDPQGKVWTAPLGSEVDGASIPRAFWSIVGGPLEGQYRNASVVHDVACDRMAEPWEAVHQMFYEACRCGGVAELKAKVLYAAVYHFGPRWDLGPDTAGVTVEAPDGTTRRMRMRRPASQAQPTVPPTEADAKALADYVERENPSPEQIRGWQPPQG